MKTDMSKMSRQHLQRTIQFSPDASMRAEAKRRLADLDRPAPMASRPSTATRAADDAYEQHLNGLIASANERVRESARIQAAREAMPANEKRMLSALRENSRPRGSKLCAVRVTLADGTSVMRHEYR